MLPVLNADHTLPAGLRFLFYCHDTFGLGHLRRTLALAEHVTTALPAAEALIVTGSPPAHAFALPPRVDYLKLPSVTKCRDGSYQARSLTMAFDALRDLRAALLREAAQAYAPDVFLVDHAPTGMQGEALPTLHALRTSRRDCLCVLGLRDIVDEPEAVRRTWAADGVYDILEHTYDRILVYGAQALFDVAAEYALPPAAARRLHYCGYLDRLPPEGASAEVPTTMQLLARLAGPPGVARRPLVVLTVGGGGDGFGALRTYLEGLRRQAEISWSSVLLTGPLMNAGEQCELHALAATLPAGSVRIEPFLADPLPLLRAADLVVSMAGYNSVCELLALRQRIVLIPRVTPRQEQRIRADLLAQRGLVQAIHPSNLTAETLLATVRAGLARPRPTAHNLAAAGIVFSGQQRALQAIVEGLGAQASRQCQEQPAREPVAMRRIP